MAQDRPHRPVTDGENDSKPPSRENRIAAARAVVYDNESDLIDQMDLEGALKAYGVTVGETENGTTEYRDIPRELSLSECHLAVDLHQDPVEFIIRQAARRQSHTVGSVES